MAVRLNVRIGGGRRRVRRRRRITFKSIRRFARFRWREARAFIRAIWKTPPAARVSIGAAIVLIFCLTINWMYHAYDKPTEIFFPIEDALDKSPHETWREYGALFRTHSTAVITPDLLAALAQMEGAGNPVGRTYWRMRLSWNPLEWYQPASSAVGMFQMTDATFEDAKRYCIHDHAVVEDGPWTDWKSCWFNSLYSRVVPSHAIELTAALLDRRVAQTLADRPGNAALLKQKEELAAVIHLCGAGAGRDFARRGFRLTLRQRCGDHDVRGYLTRVTALKRQFTRLAAAG